MLGKRKGGSRKGLVDQSLWGDREGGGREGLSSHSRRLTDFRGHKGWVHPRIKGKTIFLGWEWEMLLLSTQTSEGKFSRRGPKIWANDGGGAY